MHSLHFVLPLSALLLLPGCDKLSGLESKKSLDAEAIGYACRISLKTPEECMKENEAQSPTSVLFGWKEADKDIRDKTIDPSMGKNGPFIAQSGTPATDTEGKSLEGKASEVKPTQTAEEPKGEKPAATKAAPAAPENKAKH